MRDHAIDQRCISIRIILAMALLVLGTSARAQNLSAPKAECDRLAREAVSEAREALRLFGEFTPQGLGLSNRGEAIDLGPGEARYLEPPGDTMTALRRHLDEALRTRRVRCTALIYQATVQTSPTARRSDAIALQLTHRDGYSAVVVYPYQYREEQVILGPPQRIEQKRAAGAAPAKRNRH
ncbi:MAG TPA: hypothetical protein VFP68_13875 [Burkholderiaceae bacterium]|nr:hypothetical protein [Burkholderiaceae bacterium]